MILIKTCERCSQEFSKPYSESRPAWDKRRFCSRKCVKLDPALIAPKDQSALRQRKYRLKREFNITLNDYNKLFQRQKGRCAICGKHQSKLKTSLAVDHSHESGKIRGLLCMNCNRGIGLLNDDPSILQRALVYVRSY